ncbi:hypothetical protein TWF730_001458 [Orbilia blumenaviensis]|uniref:Uncharacterized protein n=1 Tax=Orbilia blumenaviensis TaxID=1796055 RepID=A0AAV9UL51_9PEZI
MSDIELEDAVNLDAAEPRTPPNKFPRLYELEYSSPISSAPGHSEYSGDIEIGTSSGQAKPGEFTRLFPKTRIPIGSAAAQMLVNWHLYHYGPPPRRPKFEESCAYKAKSRLQGLDWADLPDINAPRRVRSIPVDFEGTPEITEKDTNNERELTPTDQDCQTQPRSPTIIYDDYDSDDTLDVFAQHAATSPMVLVRYRTMMRKKRKKVQGSCGSTLESVQPLIPIRS